MQFSYVNPTHIHFGKGQINMVKRIIPRNHKILMIYGGGSIKTNGVYQQVVDALKKHSWQEFSGVAPNPTAEALQAAIDLIKSEAVDFILAVGGGSVIDGAKYVAAAACYEGDGIDHARSLAIVRPSLLRQQLAKKRAKLEQMGRNVFNLDSDSAATEQGLAERTITAIETLYHQLDVATRLTGHNGDKTAAIDAIIEQLEAHGMTSLGEHRKITIADSRAILNSAVA